MNKKEYLKDLIAMGYTITEALDLLKGAEEKAEDLEKEEKAEVNEKEENPEDYLSKIVTDFNSKLEAVSKRVEDVLKATQSSNIINNSIDNSNEAQAEDFLASWLNGSDNIKEEN